MQLDMSDSEELNREQATEVISMGEEMFQKENKRVVIMVGIGVQTEMLERG